ncbi:hypothetical protein POM88_043238 [Heracleum sosnowskyi]|uniref:Uncharacterized protein n=1 Tax=Heracleum sosnowskyi TaxID=360622 RepID=A0AAD8H1L6_9APIA|nr:hypothetical protein POM88_043238 [Heracleum sosnowskyi]
MLAFQLNEIGDGFDDSKAEYFRMHEYSLWGVNEGLGCEGCDRVLCKITFDVSKKSLFKLLSKKTSNRVSKSGNKAQKTKQGKKKNLKQGKKKNLEESISSIRIK